MDNYKTTRSNHKTRRRSLLSYFSLWIACYAVLSSGGCLYAQFVVSIESGVPFQTYNEVGIPNETGTRFDLVKDFETDGMVIPLRVRLEYKFSKKNQLMLLYAPLSVSYISDIPFDIRFMDTDFSSGQTVEALYKFNSYRLTYRRLFSVSGEDLQIGAGLTAKIRDARVQLSSGQLTDKKDDFGFVPLIHLFATYRFGDWQAVFEADGLAGGPGRAFDIYSGIGRNLGNNFMLKVGYRLLEGGADVRDVYNFTLIHFASAGIEIKF